jgi:hypothetical protein
MKKIVTCLIILTLLLTIFPTTLAQAAVKISETKIELVEGDTFSLKLTGTDGTIIWNTTKKNVATVNSEGVVTAGNIGKAKITAKVGKKKYVCNVTVVKNISTIKPNDAYSFVTSDIWNVFAVLDNYTRFGESSFGDDFDTTLKILDENIIKLSKYNDAVNAFDGEEYDYIKMAWTELYDYIMDIYNGFDENPPSIGNKNTWIDLERFQKLHNNLKNECSYFE